MTELHFERLLSEVSNLRVQLGGLQKLQDSSATDTIPALSRAELRIYVEAVESERKPFLLKAEGLFNVTERLSPVRTAIFLILLLDLKDRADGGTGTLDPLNEMVRAYRKLDPLATSANGSAPALLRTAAHRFSQFLEESRSFETPFHSLHLNRHELRLELLERSSQRAVTTLNVSIQSSSDVVRHVVECSFANSPITRVRRLKTAYLESGETGHDRFFRELFEHDHLVESLGTFERFSLQSQPKELLIRAGVSDSRLMQAKLMHAGFESGQCSFTEIHSVSTLIDCIRCSDSEGFKLYPKDFTAKDIAEHLKHVIYLLERYPNYQLYLTEASIPFHVVTAQVFQQKVPDCYTVFIPRFSKESLFRVNSLVVYDINLCRNVVQHVIGALCEMPITIRKRELVIARIEEVIRHLATKGPLPL